MTLVSRVQRAIGIGQLQSKRVRVRRFWARKLVLAAPGIQEYHRRASSRARLRERF